MADGLDFMDDSYDSRFAAVLGSGRGRPRISLSWTSPRAPSAPVTSVAAMTRPQRAVFARMASGRLLWRPPYGMRLRPDGTVEVDPQPWQVVRQCFHIYAGSSSLTLTQLLRVAPANVPTRHVLRRLLTNPVFHTGCLQVTYMGNVLSVPVHGAHGDRLVSAAVFTRVQTKLSP